jgi:DNA-binding SARP family transcriptional activator
MEFRLLGAAEVRLNGVVLPIGGPRQRAVLAALALHANQVVGMRNLIKSVWAEEPASPDSNLRTHVVRLRRLLNDPEINSSRLVTRDGGYLLTVLPGELDVAEFDQLAGQADRALHQDDFAATVRLGGRALALWRGMPLEGLSLGDELNAEVAQLTERHGVVAEQCVRARIALGDHSQAICELRALLATHPLREGLWAQLMIALHRSGRQAEALEAYQAIRQRLVDALGIEPGHELRRLHQAILTEEPDETGPPVVAAEPAPATERRCHQLPMDTAEFTGRAAELRTLHQLAAGGGPAVSIGAIVGMAGVGKTRLAIHAAHELVDAGRFDEVQLWADLTGFDPAQRPAEPAAVLESFLRRLGVPGHLVPAGVAERAALYRDRLYGRRVLVLLDNAANEDQVRPLLPGGPSSFVLITSRHNLAGLDGAYPLRLGEFSTAEAVELLAAITDADRVAAEPEAAGRIAALCGHLPIAIALAARRLQVRPSWRLTDLATRLAGAEHPLGQLAVGDRAIRTTFDLSYHALGRAQAELFRLLGVHPGDDVTPDSAAALLDTGPERAEELLESLLDEHLLHQVVQGRYRCHDLLRSYARERAQAELSEPQRAAALRRLLGWFLHAADRAGRVLDPLHRHTEPDPRYRPRQLPRFGHRDEAVAWFTAECANLVAAVHGGDDTVACQLTAALFSFFRLGGNQDDWAATHITALAAARRLGDRVAEALTLNRLGVLRDDQRLFADALDCYRSALAIQREVDDRRGQGWTLNNLGVTYTHRDQPETAAEVFGAALALFRDTGDRHGEGIGLNNLGDTYRSLRRLDRAARCLDQALAVQRAIGDHAGQRYTYHSMGDLHRDREQYRPAIACYERGLVIDRELGDRRQTASVLMRLGDAWRVHGRPDAADRCWQEALTIYRDIGDPDGEVAVLQDLVQLAGA